MYPQKRNLGNDGLHVRSDAFFDVEEMDTFEDAYNLKWSNDNKEMPSRGTFGLWHENELLHDATFNTHRREGQYGSDPNASPYTILVHNNDEGTEIEFVASLNKKTDPFSQPVDQLYPHRLLYPTSTVQPMAIYRVTLNSHLFSELGSESSLLKRAAVAWAVTVPAIIVAMVDMGEQNYARFAFMAMPEDLSWVDRGAKVNECMSYRLTGIGGLGPSKSLRRPVTCSFDMGTVTRDNIPTLETLCARWLYGMDTFFDSSEYQERSNSAFDVTPPVCANCEVAVQHFDSGSIDRLLVLNNYYCTVCHNHMHSKKNDWGKFRTGLAK